MTELLGTHRTTAGDGYPGKSGPEPVELGPGTTLKLPENFLGVSQRAKGLPSPEDKFELLGSDSSQRHYAKLACPVWTGRASVMPRDLWQHSAI